MNTNDKLTQALRAAEDWISRRGHGDNCYLSDHYDGDPGNQCNCGKADLEMTIDAALAAAHNAYVDERRAFEAWWRSTGSSFELVPDPNWPKGYAVSQVQCAWQAWQASHDAREGEPSPIHGLSVADGDLADYLWRVLDYYANPYSYIGERTGGILQGCPRGPNPTSQEMTQEAEIAKRRLKSAYDAAQQAAQPQPSVADWTDEQCLEFMAVGLRHAEYRNSGPTVEEIRQGARVALAAAALQPRPDARTADDDARDFGIGFTMDGLRVEPSRVTVHVSNGGAGLTIAQYLALVDGDKRESGT